MTTRSLIEALVRSTGASDPSSAIRIKARHVITAFRATFPESSIPLDIGALASFLGIGRSDELPVGSEDAELVPVGEGRVTIRINPDRPLTRTRFSIGHEITHTFFPDYQTKTWCRTDARYRQRDNPEDLLEMLCDTGASELIFPTPWFAQDAACVANGADLEELARRYIASREATLRRVAETHTDCVAAVFFSWKLKPTQRSTIGNVNQQHLFAVDGTIHARGAMRLRLDYSIPSQKFADARHFLPADKSVQNDGPIYQAAWSGRPCEGECHLDLGPAGGLYEVIAVPLWTNDSDLGPGGENGVGAIIKPLGVKSTTPQRRHTLFK